MVCAAAMGLAATGPATAQQQVGVTSATDGDPLGKPPGQNERVLRIGVDVHANELVTTGATDRAHVIFIDGTSITVGPNAQLTIDKFVYDPNTKTGELAVTAAKGVFRLVGGKISKNTPITVTTPSSTIGIRGGITIFKATVSETIAAFIFGTKLTVTAAGQTQTITRPGYQITAVAGGAPGAPTAIPKGGLTLEIAVLETGSTKSASAGGNADQRAETSGFSGQNSGQAGILANQRPRYYSYASAATNNAATNAVSNANVETQPANEASAPPPPSSSHEPPPGTRTTQTLTGYANGLVTTVNGQTVTTQTPVIGNLPNASIGTDASTSVATGTISIRQADTSVTTLQLGGTPTTGFFANDQAYGMVATDDQSRPSTVFVNNNLYVVSTSSALVSSGLTQQSGAFGSCSCEYLSWGQWVSQISYSGNYRPGQSDFIGTSAYVVGTLTTQVQMPQTGSATYNGSMMGNVWNNGNTYSATGNYTSTWSFANRGGTYNGSFDGSNFTGTATATQGSGGTNFTGSFSGGSNSGTLTGAFFAAPNDAAKYQAGSFVIGANSTTYKAAGVFAGQR